MIHALLIDSPYLDSRGRKPADRVPNVPLSTVRRASAGLQRNVLFVIAFACAASSLRAVAQDAYKIYWRGPSQVGQSQRLTSTLVEQSRTRITRGDKVIQDHTSSNRLDFSGDVTVMAVDANKRPTKVRVVVKKCMFQVGDDEAKEMLADDTVVIGEVDDGRTQFRAEDKKQPLPALAKSSLAKLIALADTGPDENSVFGGGRTSSPGDTWEADKGKLVEKFRALDATIDEEDVTGSARFDRVTTVDGKALVDIRFGMTATTDKPGNPPIGMTPVKASIRVGGNLRFPADYATNWVAQSLELRLSAKYEGKPRSRTAGQVMQYDSKQTITATAEYRESKP
ncbi:MAG: hypothetical protein MI757_22515 [Pirellulales bacterium]|nr:hypothetical protein [Pirellulales bacterium]